MKIAHSNTVIDAILEDVQDWKRTARSLEQQGNNEEAIQAYEKALKKFPGNVYIYDRLMILFRKQQDYKKELAVIEKAIEKFTAVPEPVKNNRSKKVTSLSKSILKAVGLADKKGRSTYTPQPVARWEKRKTIARKKAAGRK